MNTGKINQTILINRFLQKGKITESAFEQHVADWANMSKMYHFAEYCKFDCNRAWELIAKALPEFVLDRIKYSIKKPVRLRKHKRQYEKAKKQDIINRKWNQKRLKKEMMNVILEERNEMLECEKAAIKKVNDVWLSQHKTTKLNMNPISVGRRKKAVITNVEEKIGYYFPWIHKSKRTIERNLNKYFEEIKDAKLRLDQKENKIEPYLRDGEILFFCEDWNLTDEDREIKYDWEAWEDFWQRFKYITAPSHRDPYLEKPYSISSQIYKIIKNPTKTKPEQIDPKKSDYLRANWNSPTYWSGKGSESKESLASEIDRVDKDIIEIANNYNKLPKEELFRKFGHEDRRIQIMPQVREERIKLSKQKGVSILDEVKEDLEDEK